MRELQEIEKQRVRALTAAGLRFSLIQPTGTALTKSIMDATGPVREFLRREELHDFDRQGQGEQHKVELPARALKGGRWAPAPATLYRPTTKQGDPRIWFSRLGGFVGANNIVAIIAHERSLYVVDISRTDVEQALRSGPMSALVDVGLPSVASELLARIRTISASGPIRAIGTGSTTVGMSLEAALGVPPNSSRAPDYHGIELKAARSAEKTRVNLFAQVADWGLSTCKSSRELLDLFGYSRGADFKLYCTISSQTFNTQGLKFEVADKADQLIEQSLVRPRVAVWRMGRLRTCLLQKHPETFWVDVRSEILDGIEHFTLKRVTYTRNPNVAQLSVLLGSGVVTMDHLIKRNPQGRVTEKGPLFKIWKRDLGLLFPPPETFEL